MRLKIKLGDIFVVIAIILSAILITLNFYQENTNEKTAVIIQNNAIISRVRLDQLKESTYIDYAGEYPGTIEADNGKIRFYHAECPDQVCVETGWISRPGQIAVCLPAGVIIKIEGENTDFDVIVK